LGSRVDENSATAVARWLLLIERSDNGTRRVNGARP
jgi:hypothetical protein